jgi:cytochrome oxidase Cu insertion factor (SCO1/SenC/PrrC family)
VAEEKVAEGQSGASSGGPGNDEHGVAHEEPAPAPGAATSGAARPARRHALAAAPGGIPRRALVTFVVVVLAAVAIVTVADRFISSGPAQPTTFPQEGHGPVGGKAAPVGSSQLHSSLADLIGLTTLHGPPEPQWTLTDVANGRPVSSSSLLHHVVVLTFANATCTDICTVLATELARADQLLGRTTTPVTFVTVNTDPLTTAATKPAILANPSLASLGNWRFLSGPIAQLNPVWKSFGISITVNQETRKVSHNDLLYFISPQGKMVWSAIPFANESSKGVFSLSNQLADRFAKGIAAYAGRLAGAT